MAAPTSPSIAELAGRGRSAQLAEWCGQARRFEDNYVGVPEWNYIDYVGVNGTGFAARSSLTHGDWLVVKNWLSLEGYPSAVPPDLSLPDAAPVGTQVAMSDDQPYCGHIDGFSPSSALPIADPEHLLYPEDWTFFNGKWFAGGPPHGRLNGVMFTRTVSGWTAQCIPLGTSWAPHSVVSTPYTPGTAWVNSHGHCPRDEANNGSPQGWKALPGHYYAPYYSLQEAYDNMSGLWDDINFIVDKQDEFWSPGGIKLRGISNETLTFVGSESGVVIGKIECVLFNGANVTRAPGGPPMEESEWIYSLEQRHIYMNLVGSANVLFTEIELRAGDGPPAPDGANTGDPGTTGSAGYDATIVLVDCVAASPINAVAVGSSGGMGGSGGSATSSDGDGYLGGDGGTGGGAYVYLTNCTNILASKTPGAGGAGGGGGSAGGDEGTVAGAQGATGAAGTTN